MDRCLKSILLICTLATQNSQIGTTQSSLHCSKPIGSPPSSSTVSYTVFYPSKACKGCDPLFPTTSLSMEDSCFL